MLSMGDGPLFTAYMVLKGGPLPRGSGSRLSPKPRRTRRGSGRTRQPRKSVRAQPSAEEAQK